ncbi:hypothetical protein VB716_09910 [Synechococcus sp. CCY9201]|nr:hypothetical protein [Synechococcus sp. CCY9201]
MSRFLTQPLELLATLVPVLLLAVLVARAEESSPCAATPALQRPAVPADVRGSGGSETGISTHSQLVCGSEAPRLW